MKRMSRSGTRTSLGENLKFHLCICLSMYLSRSCERLVVTCVCGDSITLDSPVVGAGRDVSPALLTCPRPKSCGGFPLQAEEKIANSMDLLIRKNINKYYAGTV